MWLTGGRSLLGESGPSPAVEVGRRSWTPVFALPKKGGRRKDQAWEGSEFMVAAGEHGVPGRVSLCLASPAEGTLVQQMLKSLCKGIALAGPGGLSICDRAYDSDPFVPSWE